jgi:hypothetical protein
MDALHEDLYAVLRQSPVHIVCAVMKQDVKALLNNVHKTCIGVFFAEFTSFRISTPKFSETLKRPNAEPIFFDSDYDNIIL